MSDYLLEIAFGPIQGFIAASRRTADLWGGSRILSEIARAAALSLLKDGAQLIYPLQERIDGVQPADSSNLSNVLLVQINGSDETLVAEIAQRAMQAGKNVVVQYSAKAKQDWRKLEIREDIWDKQVEDAVENFAAWAKIEGDYNSAYKDLKAAFAARKNTRDFIPFAWDGEGIPKSSLDGLRETVLPPKAKQGEKPRRFPPQYRINEGEQLDAIGCIKRYVGMSEKFTPLTRLAADPWLQRLGDEILKQICEAYEPLVAAGYATRVKGNDETYKDFPYDGALLYQDRISKTIADTQKSGEDSNALEHLRAILRGVWKEHQHPSPYAALLMADGDRMGKFISAAKNAEEHTDISRALASFADESIQHIRELRGHTVYAGGEDIMALLPLPAVVILARKLAKNFDERIAETKIAKQVTEVTKQRSTLRVGVAICHVLEPLGTIRQYAEAAEKFAKGAAGSDKQGNALGLRLHVRAGHDIPCRIGFHDTQKFDLFADWMKAYETDVFPGRLAYDTRAIGKHCKQRGYDPAVAQAEFKLLLARAKQYSRDKNNSVWNKKHLVWNELEEYIAHKDDTIAMLTELGNELVLARWMAAKNAADTGER